MTKVLVVEPDPIYRKLFPIWMRDHFGGWSLEVFSVAGAGEAEEAAHRLHPDLLLTAFELEGETDGLHLAWRIREILGELRVILISQTAYSCLRRRLAKLPRTQFLAKPVGERTFIDVLEGMLPRSAEKGT
jgi:CheY-like chemotaxis protein